VQRRLAPGAENRRFAKGVLALLALLLAQKYLLALRGQNFFTTPPHVGDLPKVCLLYLLYQYKSTKVQILTPAPRVCDLPKVCLLY